MSLEFRQIAHAYGNVPALCDVSFTAPTGEITCLLGSSGSGKSTLLNLAAGLLEVQQGSVHADGELMCGAGIHPPPEARGVGLVFQEGALFPHMTVARNVAFGLPRERHDEIEGWLERVGLAGLGGRFPHELSGGQQQRAALARAMAPGPRVLLMDEPFASVDIVLRRSLRRECRMLLRSRGTTTVLVTHDPEEALDIGDRIAVMEEGRIVQFGSPEQLHNEPATASVGAIFGGAQVVRASIEGDRLRTPFGLWPRGAVAGALPETQALDLLIEANRLDALIADKSGDEAGLAVRDVHPLGTFNRVLLVARGGEEITIETAEAVDRNARYLAVPRNGSLRAFPRI